VRRLWAAVKLTVLGAVLGTAIGLGTGLGATALFRWGEGQSAVPAGERAPEALSLAAADPDVECRGGGRHQSPDRRFPPPLSGRDRARAP